MQLRASSDTVLCTIEQFWSPLLFGIFYVFGADFLAFFLWKMCFWSRGDADSNFYFSIFEAGWKICKYLDFVTWASNTQKILDRLCHLLFLTISWNPQRRWSCYWNIVPKNEIVTETFAKKVVNETFPKRVKLWLKYKTFPGLHQRCPGVCDSISATKFLHRRKRRKGIVAILNVRRKHKPGVSVLFLMIQGMLSLYQKFQCKFHLKPY